MPKLAETTYTLREIEQIERLVQQPWFEDISRVRAAMEAREAETIKVVGAPGALTHAVKLAKFASELRKAWALDTFPAVDSQKQGNAS